MGIYFDQEKKLFKLDTNNTSYIMVILEEKYLGHIYYGQKLQYAGGEYLLKKERPVIRNIHFSPW